MSREVFVFCKENLSVTDFSYYNEELLLVTGNICVGVEFKFFLWQVIKSCDMKYFLSVTKILCDRKSFLVTDNIKARKFILKTKWGDSIKDFLWGLRISCHLGCQDAHKNPNLSKRIGGRLLGCFLNGWVRCWIGRWI